MPPIYRRFSNRHSDSRGTDNEIPRWMTKLFPEVDGRSTDAANHKTKKRAVFDRTSADLGWQKKIKTEVEESKLTNFVCKVVVKKLKLKIAVAKKKKLSKLRIDLKRLSDETIAYYSIPKKRTLLFTTPFVTSALAHLFIDQLKDPERGSLSPKREITVRNPWPPQVKRFSHKVTPGLEATNNADTQYLMSVKVAADGDKCDEVKSGSFVRFQVSGRTGSRDSDFYVVKVISIFSVRHRILCHGVRFVHGQETIVGKPLNPREIFATYQCSNFDLSHLHDVIEVISGAACLIY